MKDILTKAIFNADGLIPAVVQDARTREVLTLDHRHFDVLRPLSGGRFKILP